MQRATILVLSLVLLAACTAPTSPPEPSIERFLVNGFSGRQDASSVLSTTLETHGITCSGFEGSIWGSGDDRHWGWRTTCSGTERQWRQAESDIARLTAEGIVADPAKPKTE